jgi:hypothetical protein
MRTSGMLLAGLLLAGVAAGEDDSCLKAVGALAQKTLDRSASWNERYEAYKDAKTALETGDEKCLAAYEAIRTDVADGLRREAVPASGWLLGLFGACLLWGGFAVCCVVAARSGRSGTEED